MARTFAGGTDKVVVGSGMIGGLAAAASVTFSAWIRPTGSLTAYQGIVDSPNRMISALLGGAANHLYVSFGGTQGEFTLTASWVINTWQHLCMTQIGAGSTVTIYKNGVSVNSTFLGTPAYSADALSFGANPSGGGAAYTGAIAEPTIWNVALTAGEIAALANGVRAKMVRPGSQIGYFPLGLASPEPDYSGNGHNGTVTGTSVTAHPPIDLSTWTAPSVGDLGSVITTFNPGWAYGATKTIGGIF